MRRNTVLRAPFLGALAVVAATLLAISGLAFGDEPAKKIWPNEEKGIEQPPSPSVDTDESGNRDEGNKADTQPGTSGVAPGGTNATSIAASGKPAGSAALAAPSNDDCSGAIPIPAGSYPVVTAPVDIADAASGDEPGMCGPTDGTIWYSFTPTVTGSYIITTCPASGATGSTLADSVLAVFGSTAGACPATSQIVCDDSTACGTAGFDGAKVQTVLTAGTTYFIVAGKWSPQGPVSAPNSSIAISVDISPAPANDTCAGATPMTLSRALEGTTANANNDYQTPSTAACFAGVGQTPTTSAGRDVVYSFTAPSDGSYSFRMFSQASPPFGWPSPPIDTTQNFDLYVASDCPASGTVSCLGGANRMTAVASGVDNRGEEVSCLPLTGGQTVYVYVDNAAAGNSGITYSIEAYPCYAEAEPNNTPATASAPSCPATGSISPSGDVDFWSLGTVGVDDRIFAYVDGITANSNDFDMRITTDTDTLEYDDADQGPLFGGNFAPVVAGTPGTGVPTYIRVNHFSATTAAEPYRLQYVVEPPLADAAPPATEPDYPTLSRSAASTKNYFYGGLTPGDMDIFRLCAETGDLVSLFVDGDPLRDGTPFNPALFMWLYSGGSNVFGRNETNFTSVLTPSPGTLTGTTPRFPAETVYFRARYTGVHFVGVNGQNPLTFGDYLVSMGINCGKPQRSSDITIAMTGPASPVATSSMQTYTITVTNNGMIAQDVRMEDVLPPELLFQDLSAFGSSTSGLTCTTPDIGTSGTIVCTNFCMAPGDSLTYTVTVQIRGCIGNDVSVTNTATVSSLSTDTNLDNNSASATVTTSDDNTCTDNDACTVGDHCDAGECVVDGPLECDDNNACTDQYCDSAIGCVYDPSPGQQCNDGIACTQDLCDPVLGSGSIPCYFPPVDCDDGNPCTADFCEEATGACGHTPVAAGVSCDDGDACTEATSCDGAGTCGGGTPITCDDSNGCTDDSCNPASGCVFTPNAATCDDGDACTTNDTCGGGTCNGGPALNCDDGNLCTDDACNPASGCYWTNNVAPCDDGNACTLTDVCTAGFCVGGNPVVCTALDQCHDPGVCDPGSGLCSNPNKPNGTTCNDGDTCTTSDACQEGVCTGPNTALAEPNPRTNGYYKRLCIGPHSGDALTAADAACVADVAAATFGWVSSVADICEVIQPSQPNNDKCQQSEDDLMVLALNICKARVCPIQGIDSQCGPNVTVAQNLAESDAIFSSSTRNFDTCQHGKCLDEEINTGRALVMNSLMLNRAAVGVTLTWEQPYVNDGSAIRQYNVWRRIVGNEAFTKLATVTSTTYTDPTDGDFEYEVTAVK